MKLDEERTLSLLGLASRAGAVARGTEAARAAVRRGDARLVLLAQDGAAPQIRKVEGLARNRTVSYRTFADRARLGAAVGGPPLTAVAVTNASFAGELVRLMGRDTGTGSGARGPDDLEMTQQPENEG